MKSRQIRQPEAWRALDFLSTGGQACRTASPDGNDGHTIGSAREFGAHRRVAPDGASAGADALANLAVVGLGHVGLPTAPAVHAAGFAVIGIGASDDRVASIRRGHPDLRQSDRRRLDLARADASRFRIGRDPTALEHADCVLVAVPTPLDSRQIPDLEHLRRACATVVEHARRGQVIVLTSTGYVGCTRDLLARRLAERGLIPGSDVFVCFAPERVDPGINEFELTAVPKLLGGVTSACAAAAAPTLPGTCPRYGRVASRGDRHEHHR